MEGTPRGRGQGQGWATRRPRPLSGLERSVSRGTRLQSVSREVLCFEGDDGKHHAGRTGAWDLRQESCHLAAAQPDAFSLASWC